MGKPLTFRVLCAIATAELAHDPTIDDAEWSERIKRRLVAQGWDYPSPPHQMSDAMIRTEHALRKRGITRPTPTLARQTYELAPSRAPLDAIMPRTFRSPSDFASVASIVDALRPLLEKGKPHERPLRCVPGVRRRTAEGERKSVRLAGSGAARDRDNG